MGMPHCLSEVFEGLSIALVASAVCLGFIRRKFRAITAAHSRLRSVFESIPDGVILMDSDGAIVEANRSAARLLGAADAKELLGALSAFEDRYLFHRFEKNGSLQAR